MREPLLEDPFYRTLQMGKKKAKSANTIVVLRFGFFLTLPRGDVPQGQRGYGSIHNPIGSLARAKGCPKSTLCRKT
jgi:hypothetical protein